MLWVENGSLIPHSGTLFLTQVSSPEFEATVPHLTTQLFKPQEILSYSSVQESVAFKSSQFRRILPFQCISGITKQMTLGMVSKSIKITTTGDALAISAAQGNHPPRSPRSHHKDPSIPLEITLTSIDRNSTWVVLDSLWQDYVGKWRRKLDPNGLGKESHQNRISKNMAQLEKDMQKVKFYTEFQVTDSPNPNTTFTGLLWITSAYMIGTIFVTDNFLCMCHFRICCPFMIVGLF